jgi:hypothetical protein
MFQKGNTFIHLASERDSIEGGFIPTKEKKKKAGKCGIQ